MKFNVKSLIIAAVAAMGCLFGVQGATLQFSSEANPVWYQIKFVNGGAALADKGAGNNAMTEVADDVDSQKWQFIGTDTDFTLRSKGGNYLVFSNERFASGSEGVSLCITASGTNYEIGRVGKSDKMNQFGGQGAGRQLGEWTSGDKGNLLQIIDSDGNAVNVGPSLPVFSAEGAETWYFLNFRNGDNVLEAKGTGQSAIRSKAAPVAGSIWKITGTQDNAQFVSQSGEYLVIEGTGEGCVKTASSPYAAGFSLEIYEGNNFPKTWQIKDNATSGAQAYINQHGGVSVGGKFGLWKGNDVNDAMQFVPVDQMTYGEFTIVGTDSWTPANQNTLWYTAPGTDWQNWGLPIGNGRFGAQILGGVNEEEVSFTEKTLWSGRSTDHGGSNFKGYGSFQGFGNLMINADLTDTPFGWDDSKAVKNYRRMLDLETATAGVYFTSADGETDFAREFIASYPDGVVAIHLTATKPGSLSQTFSFQPGVVHAENLALEDPVTYTADGYGRFGGSLETVSYEAVFKVVPVGGTMTASDKGVNVSGADEILVILAGNTDYDCLSPSYTANTDALAANVKAIADAAAAKGWETLYADHLADYQPLFSRVNLQIDGADHSLTTLQLIQQYNNGNGPESVCRQLEQLYFQYGRYLALGSSRGIAVPNNLQGIWTGWNRNRWYSNGYAISPWNADIHANINIEMNYWPTEPTNLSETHLPFLEYIINMATVQPQWRENPTKFVSNPASTKGWSIFNENNIFGAGSNWGNNYVVANAWYCTHLWQHYAFTLDKEFLSRAMPVMWGACEFWIERLKLVKGEYLCPNEQSPEHGPGSEDGVAHAQQIVAELFDNTLSAIEALGEENCGISADDIATLRERNEKLDRGLNTEKFTAKSGWTANGVQKNDLLLREWKYSAYTAGQNGHRHLSHLMCLYPFGQVPPTSDYFVPAVNSLKQRGDGATGWSMGWKINLWARALDGDHSHLILKNALTTGIYNNLYDKHAPFQIDGNFGATSGITEMLLQSHDGVYLLPALPSAWKSGEVSGLKARGNFTVDVKWSDNKLKEAKIVSNKGSLLRLRSADLLNTRLTLNGQVIEPVVNVSRYFTEIPTGEGDVLTAEYDPEYTQPNTVEDNEPVSIADVDADSMTVSVSNGEVIVDGAISMTVYDMTGRTIAQGIDSAKVSAHGPALVSAIAKDGTTHNFKIIL